eukprot:jgi/Hompol1/43/HPOL_005206-RA
MVVVNAYRGPSECVGAHGDKMTYIGPRPVIASLTLGAARTFRLKRLPTPSQPSKTYDILLPHNSLLIMWPPTQELYKHEVPRVSASLTHPLGTLIPHSISGETRINLTYRMARPEVFSQIPNCFCGTPAELRVVNKLKSIENQGKYFWLCGGGGVPTSNATASTTPPSTDGQNTQKPSELSCGFFK